MNTTKKLMTLLLALLACMSGKQFPFLFLYLRHDFKI